MAFIKNLIVSSLVILYSISIIAQENSVQFKICGRKKIRYKGLVVLKIEIVNNSKDTIEFYRPGVIYGGLEGYYFKKSSSYNFGIIYNDSVLLWKGHCSLNLPKEKIYFTLHNGIHINNLKKQKKISEKLIQLVPNKIFKDKMFIWVSNCYDLKKDEIYTLSVIYNHIVRNEGTKPHKIESNQKEYFKNLFEGKYTFTYKGN